MKKLLIVLLLALTVYADEFKETNAFNLAVEAYNKGNYIKALDGFYTLAKNGNAKSQFNLGMIYAEGTGVKENKEKAIHWYEKAARQKNAKAAYNLGRIYHESAKDDIHGYEKAKYWYEKALEGKVKEAYTNLAALYMEGKAVTKDEKKAFDLLKKAAKMGESAAQVNIGKCMHGERISCMINLKPMKT